MKANPLGIIGLFVALVLASLAGAWVKAQLIDHVEFVPNWQFIIIVAAAVTSVSVFLSMRR